MRVLSILFSLLVFQHAFSQDNCGCNEKEIAFSEKYANNHQLIFRGKTLNINKGTDYDKVTFLIGKLFKGKAPQQLDVYFDSKNDCSLKFTVGEDWLMYTNYNKGKAFALYCSRCRKNVINTNKNIDLMYVKSDISMDEETEKLSELCGLQHFAETINDNQNIAHNNIIPNGFQRILLIILSLIGCAAIYFLMNKLWKK